MFKANGAVSQAHMSASSRLLSAGIAAVCFFAIATTTPALAQTRSIIIQSFGEPPRELIKYVAEIGVPDVIDLAAGQAALDRASGRCGYRSPDSLAALAESIVAQNGDRFATEVATRVPITVKTQLVLPACIVYVTRKEVTVGSNQGIGQAVSKELKVAYVPSNKVAWGAFYDSLCKDENNRGVVSCKSSDNLNPTLQPGTIVFPVGTATTLLRIKPEKDFAQILKLELPDQLAAAQVATNGLFQVTAALAKTPQVRPIQPGQCAEPDSPSQPFDIVTFYKLAEAYAQAATALTNGARRHAVLTLIDTGTDRDTRWIENRIFRTGTGVDLLADSSNAQRPLDDTKQALREHTITPDFERNYPIAEYYMVDNDRIANPVDVNPLHGTFVANIALGGPSIASASPSVLPKDWPKLRVFRALVKYEESPDKYALNFEALENALKFVVARGRGEDAPYQVVNMSVATTVSPQLRRLFKDATAKTLFVVAAGNEGKEIFDGPGGSVTDTFPSAFGGLHSEAGTSVVSVAALGENRRTAWEWTNHSKQFVDLFAWGECQPVQSNNDGVIWAKGTSVAAPWVTLTAEAIYEGTMPLEGHAHPAYIKNRILSSGRASQELAEDSESGAILDPVRAVDVAVDHFTLASGTNVRGLVDYNQSDSPCSDILAFRNISRLESSQTINKLKFRVRDQSYTGTPQQTGLHPCKLGSSDLKVVVYPDTTFEAAVASHKLGQPMTIYFRDITDYVARDRGDRPDWTPEFLLKHPTFGPLLVSTTKIVAHQSASGGN
jgi:Subtilase family